MRDTYHPEIKNIQNKLYEILDNPKFRIEYFNKEVSDAELAKIADKILELKQEHFSEVVGLRYANFVEAQDNLTQVLQFTYASYQKFMNDVAGIDTEKDPMKQKEKLTDLLHKLNDIREKIAN